MAPTVAPASCRHFIVVHASRLHIVRTLEIPFQRANITQQLQRS